MPQQRRRESVNNPLHLAPPRPCRLSKMLRAKHLQLRQPIMERLVLLQRSVEVSGGHARDGGEEEKEHDFFDVVVVVEHFEPGRDEEEEVCDVGEVVGWGG